MLLVHLMDALKARRSPYGANQGGRDTHRSFEYSRWLHEWPLEPPFPGMVSGLNKFGEKYWASPVKVFTREEIEAYVSESNQE